MRTNHSIAIASIKADVAIAKNYLNEQEMNYLERIVSVYLDFAELQAERKIPMSMEDWATRLDGFLEFNGNEILTGAGKISHEQAKLHAETEYEKYRIVQDRLFKSDFDKLLEEVSYNPE
ncbi:MAG: virulence RhuM family protein [Clostridiales Family XIII bacterium]|nr:virulence RhuM family protein [Clostridiales Family XIII bacterium]